MVIKVALKSTVNLKAVYPPSIAPTHTELKNRHLTHGRSNIFINKLGTLFLIFFCVPLERTHAFFEVTFICIRGSEMENVLSFGMVAK